MLSGAQLQTLLDLAGITPRSVFHRGVPVVLLAFPMEQAQTIQAVRQVGGRWSQTHQSWYVPRNAAVLQKLLEVLGYGLEQVHPRGAAALAALERQIALKGYSPATRRNYVYAFKAFLCHFSEADPQHIGREQIEAYLLYLSGEQGNSETAVHMAMNAIKFYYEAVLRGDKEWFNIYRPKKPLQNPRFFSKEEVAAILNHTTNLKHKVLLMLCYSAGLRVSEVVSLKVRQIDSRRMCIYLQGAKGKKDRIAPLSNTVLVLLRDYFRKYRPKEYLFEGEVAGAPYSKRSAQAVLSQAKERARILKPGSIHALRHSFATHLRDKGTDVVMIQ